MSMENNWAAENLQTIRTLMERSAVYRRALAPITTYVGVVGIAAALLGGPLGVQYTAAFSIYWMCVSIVALGGAILLVRRQAIKEREPLFSPPTRRVIYAMLPALFLGACAGIQFIRGSGGREEFEPQIGQEMLIVCWVLLYGLALHAASFFMPRGVRLFALAFVLFAAAMILLFTNVEFEAHSRHLQMGVLFGCSHLAYGIYLYFTEPRKNEA